METLYSQCYCAARSGNNLAKSLTNSGTKVNVFGTETWFIQPRRTVRQIRTRKAYQRAKAMVVATQGAPLSGAYRVLTRRSLNQIPNKANICVDPYLRRLTYTASLVAIARSGSAVCEVECTIVYVIFAVYSTKY